MDLGPHAAFIIGSYAVVTVVMIGLVAWLILDGRRYRRVLEMLEAQGVRRRSRQSGGA